MNRAYPFQCERGHGHKTQEAADSCELCYKEDHNPDGTRRYFEHTISVASPSSPIGHTPVRIRCPHTGDESSRSLCVICALESVADKAASLLVAERTKEDFMEEMEQLFDTCCALDKLGYREPRLVLEEDNEDSENQLRDPQAQAAELEVHAPRD